MCDTEEKVAKLISDLGLPAIFSEIWQTNEPRRFCRQWTKPVAFFEQRQQLIRRCPRIERCAPLLESNRNRIVAIEPSTENYVEFFFEDDEVEEIGTSYQQFLSTLFVDLGYAGLEDLVEEVSGRFGYRHMDAFTAFMEIDDDQPAEEAKKAFVSTIEN